MKFDHAPEDTLPITYLNPEPAIPITWEIAEELNLVDEDRRFDMKCFGPWQICTSIKGVRMSTHYQPDPVYTRIKGLTVWGVGTISRPREAGYHMEGKASIPMLGKVRAFTSSQMFKLPTGELRTCAEICCCVPQFTTPQS